MLGTFCTLRRNQTALCLYLEHNCYTPLGILLKMGEGEGGEANDEILQEEFKSMITVDDMGRGVKQTLDLRGHHV